MTERGLTLTELAVDLSDKGGDSQSWDYEWQTRDIILHNNWGDRISILNFVA